MATKRKNKRNNKLYTIGTIIVALILVGTFYEIGHKTSQNNTADSTSKHITANTSQPTSQPSASQTPSIATPTNSGGVVDKNGQSVSSLPSSSDWTTSSSGNITLQLPTANQTLQSGDSITGLANVSAVQFILKDDSVGQIAEGNLNVVNGKFSGTLYFTPHSESGELEVYYPNPNTGAEEDTVSIDVNFSP